ncbi:MAG: succinate dehydrogenase, cytochrome b556 subunit [Thiogranum sp.]|nr:succinate dehydrogenase, cytochrome b556 subunit [Thiogranum sp.]
MAKQKAAPRYLNLFRIKLPVGGVTSIGHRISGVLMFLLIPLAVWLFALSLESAEGFRQVNDYLDSPPLLALSLLLVWSLSHHLLAGIRHLFFDIDIGMEKETARASAWVVNIGALLITLLYLVRLL